MSNVPDRPSSARRLVTLAATHPIITAGLAAIAGLGAGWILGGWSSCSSSTAGCTVGADAVEAAGTWIGSAGTILAVVAAVVALRSGEQSRLDMLDAQRRAEKAVRDRLIGAADTVFFNATVGEYHQGNPWRIDFTIENHAGRTITSVMIGLRHPTLGEHFLPVQAVANDSQSDVRLHLKEPADTPDDLYAITTLYFNLEGVTFQRRGIRPIEELPRDD